MPILSEMNRKRAIDLWAGVPAPKQNYRKPVLAFKFGFYWLGFRRSNGDLVLSPFRFTTASVAISHTSTPHVQQWLRAIAEAPCH